MVLVADWNRGSSSEDALVVALDFGTTFSGIAYAFTTDPEKIYTITNWPGADDKVVPKAPTVIEYENGSKTSFKWGYEVDPLSETKIANLKLLLDPGQPRPYFIPIDGEAEVEKLPKSPVEVISDYMGAMFKHAIAEIVRESLDPEFLDNFQKRFILTVPAVWSDKAKSLTLRAAQRAGIFPVEMITEPEAAALVTLLTVKNKGLRESDAIIICDAGGGTVDLVAYEVDSVNPLKLRALTAPSGGICGSVMVNKLFEEEVRKAVPEPAYSTLKKTRAFQSALTEFDSLLKPGFRGKSDPDRYATFPMAGLKNNKAAGLVSNSLTLSGATMVRIFDPVVREVEKLVLDQAVRVKLERVKAGQPPAIKAIFLVGGFGASAYLKAIIEKSNPGVLVIQPKEAWSSIMRGAAMSVVCSAPVITSTRAPKHYGTDGLSVWYQARDFGQKKHWDPWDEVWRCDVMSWFIHKDDELVREKKLKIAFCSVWPGTAIPTGDALTVTHTLRESGAATAPPHPFDTTINCELQTNVSGVPLHFFKQKYRDSDNAPYMHLSYNVQIENNQSGLMKFSLEIGGKEYGSVEAAY